LERAVWFDVLVVAPGTELQQDTDGRVRYERLNPEPDPPLVIYRRLR
jgi:hypothetical protein